MSQPFSSPKTRPVVAIMTDFGLGESDVGVMKGVITGIVPDAQIIDITHDVAPLCAWSTLAWEVHALPLPFMLATGTLSAQTMDFSVIFLPSRLSTRPLRSQIPLITCHRLARPFMDVIFLPRRRPTWQAAFPCTS